MDREKLNVRDIAAEPHGTQDTEGVAYDGEQINLSNFMMTGRELLSRRGTQQSRKEDEIRQDLAHQSLFFYSIETFSRNNYGRIAEIS